MLHAWHLPSDTRPLSLTPKTKRTSRSVHILAKTCGLALQGSWTWTCDDLCLSVVKATSYYYALETFFYPCPGTAAETATEPSWLVRCLLLLFRVATSSMISNVCLILIGGAVSQTPTSSHPTVQAAPGHAQVWPLH